jgi:O-antigen/teichoic acid export membrane protein
MLPLLKNAAVYSASNILNGLIPFLLLPVLTRVLLPSDYGVLAVFSAALGLLGAFTGLSVNGVVNVRFVDRENIDFPCYVGSCLCVLLFSTFLTLILVGILHEPLSNFTAIPTFWLLTAVIVSGCNFLIQVRLGIWMMMKKPVAYGTFQLLLSLVNMGLSLSFVLLLKYGYEGRLWGQTLAIFAFAAIGYLSLINDGWVKFRPRWDYVREILVFGVPLIPHVIGAFLASQADRFIVNQHLGLASAGVYMVAAQFGMGLGLLADAFNKAFVPWLYEQLKADDPKTKQRIVLGTWCYFALALGLAGIVALLSRWIVLLVAGAGYLGAAKVLPWLALGQAFVGMYYMVANYIFYKRRTGILAWITLLTGGVGVGLVWVLTPILGISGAGIAFAFAMSLRFVLTWMLAQRVCPMSWFFWAQGASTRFHGRTK